MTGPNPEIEDPGTRPLSVAELLARNGTIGAPANTRRRRRRRGDNDAVTVAELTGELPVIGDDDETDHATSGPEDAEADRVTEEQPKTAYWSEPEPRWPKSPPQPQRATGPERSAYPRPVRQIDAGEAEPQLLRHERLEPPAVAGRQGLGQGREHRAIRAARSG